MGNNERTRQAQFELMVSYMERHGDVHYLSDKWERHKKWIELAALLNNNTLGEPKPVGKWRKCWSDFKNNTKKKDLRIKKKDCRTDLSRLEKRLLKLLESQKDKMRKTSDLDNETTITFKAETVPQEDSCQMPLSPVSPPQCYNRDVQNDLAGHRKSSTFSSMSETSNEEGPTPGKRKRSFKDNIKDVADKYLEFEREREKLAHEREMARIKQNDQLITIFGKVVNVLETLAPSIQNYLDRDTNNDR